MLLAPERLADVSATVLVANAQTWYVWKLAFSSTHSKMVIVNKSNMLSLCVVVLISKLLVAILLGL